MLFTAVKNLLRNCRVVCGCAGALIVFAPAIQAETDMDDDPQAEVPHAFFTTPDVAESPAKNSAHVFPLLTPKLSPIAPAAQQPVGALSGRIVFMNSGHGWTWYTNTGWSLQREVALNAMNEDYGNWDQLNFFAAYCFNAGAVVVSMRPLGDQTNEVIIDNTSPSVTWAGTWFDSSQTVFYGNAGDVPYRYATLNATETATATYTPNLPVAGYYPVYTWVLTGSDRGDQLYRIRHTGGETQIRIPHYMVGSGWIYLGEYYFNAGSNSLNGAVVVSNLRGSATGTYTFADAIRFGNGMGSVDRGTGVSGYPRQDESCRYWIQANLGHGQSTSLYETSGTDEQDSWSAPGRMSAEMNREQAGSMFKRIHLSFHSNASGDGNTRGVEGLITGVSTAHQAELARLCGQTVNDELVGLSPSLEFPWYNRGTNITYTGGYGEISDNNFNSEMDATIIEVAYHDDVTDAALLCDPKVRNAVARAAMHAVVKYMNEFDITDPVPLIFLPEPPANVRAIGGTNGSVALAWLPPVSVANSGAPTNYIVYQSTNGYGFGNPISVGNVTNFTVTNLPSGVDYYFRVAAANAGGESFPSMVVGCRPPLFATSKKVLFVNAFDRFDRTLDLKQNVVPQHYVPPSATGGNSRVLPRRINSFDYVVPHGKAVSAAGVAFDSCQHIAITNDLVALTNYAVVIWECGNESTADESFSSLEQTKITTFLAGGGSLFTSGSEIAWDLDHSGSAADKNFIHNQLHASYVADSSGVWNFTAPGTSIFSNNPSGTFDDGSKGIYIVGYPDVIAPSGSGAVASVNYSNVTSGAAGITYNGAAGGGKVVYLGFPFETILDAGVRNAYMADTLDFFNVQPLKFESIQPLPGKQLKLTMSALTGNFQLQTAAVLNVWGPLTNLTNATGAFQFMDTITNSGARFYRVKTLP